MGYKRPILKHKDKEDDGPATQDRLRGNGLEPIKDANLSISSSSEGDVGSMEGDLPLYGKPRGIITKKRMTEIVLRYRMPPKFICRLPSIVQKDILELDFTSPFTLLLTNF